MFHNLIDYDSNLIMQEIGKFDVKIDVLLNGLVKYMAFVVNKNLVFIDSIQFMNSSLDVSVKNFFDNDFIYLSQEFCGKLLELVIQKDVYPYEYMNSFKKFFDDRLPYKYVFYSSLRGECISENNSVHAINVWNMFEMKTIVNY